MVLAVVKKPALGFVITAVLLTVIAIFYFRSDDADKSAARYDTAPVERGPIIAKVTASGTLSALVTVQVGSQVSGRIKEILVDFNAPVKKDQTIARIDPQIFEANLAQARANHLAARANLRRSEVQALEADRQYERAKTLG